MSREEDYEICCYLTPLPSINEEGEDSFPCNMFRIEILARFVRWSNLALEEGAEEAYDEDEFLFYDSDCDTFESELLLKRDELVLGEESSRSAIRSSLIDLGVPVQPFIIDRIIDGARNMAGDNRYLGCKVLRLRVTIDLPPMDVINIGGSGSSGGDDEVLNLEPASKSSIDSLDRVKVEGSMHCTICFEEISNGSEATRMPCTHLFHDKCICNWLKTNRVCPLCRFEIA